VVTALVAHVVVRPVAVLRWGRCSGADVLTPMAHREHSGQGEEVAGSPWRRGDGEAVEWVGTVALQRWWGSTAIAGDLGRLQRHPWNRREVSISSIERIFQSVGRSLNGGRNDGARPKIR
jgi:hypothetical protein